MCVPALDKYKRTPMHWAGYFGKLSALVAIMNHEAGGGRCVCVCVCARVCV